MKLIRYVIAPEMAHVEGILHTAMSHRTKKSADAFLTKALKAAPRIWQNDKIYRVVLTIEEIRDES